MTVQSIESIECRGVRTHNLKNIDVAFPLKKWIAVTGVSGTGKSSLVFDTLYAEAQRRFLETLGTYERQFLHGLPEGDFDAIDNLPASIALKQTHQSLDPKSTIATASDVAEPFQTLFMALMPPSCARCGSPAVNHSSSDILDFFLAEKKKNPLQSFAVTLQSFGKSEKLIKSLLVEGYTRFVLDNRIVDLESYTDVETPCDLEIVLDVISCVFLQEELANRIETLWSQVRFSDHFTTLKIIPVDEEKKIFGSGVFFHVQPFCEYCCSQTELIQSRDLNWRSVLGACQKCYGIGNIAVLDEHKVIPNPKLSLSEGAVKPWQSQTFLWLQENLLKACRAKKIDIHLPYCDLSQADKDWIWSGDSESSKTKVKNRPQFSSLSEFFNLLESERYKPSSRILLAKYRKYIVCPECQGARMNKAGRRAVCFGKSYFHLFQQEIVHTLSWLKELKGKDAFLKKKDKLSEAYDEVEKKISLLVDLGLGSASLFRRCKTLSGGEYQRVLLTRVLGNGLTDALYVLDEPSVGLGKTEIPSLVSCLRKLCDLGNTIVMVEHDPGLVSAADHIIELGLGGGENGGSLISVKDGVPLSFASCFNGKQKKKFQEILDNKSHFNRLNSLCLKNFSALNCHHLNCEILIGAMNVITGPSGSGKSTLLTYGLQAALSQFYETGFLFHENFSDDEKKGIWDELQIPPDFLAKQELVFVEQKSLHRTSSSVPATVLGLMDFLRRQFAATAEAKDQGLSTSDFSFNGSGQCTECGGTGCISEDLFFLGEVEKICPECKGYRYKKRVLEINWHGKNISQWLLTSLQDCLIAFKTIPGCLKTLSLACELGLGHIPLGALTTTLSGGEAQRLRICAALTKSEKKIFCLLDEPTRGLSEKDIGQLMSTLLRLTSEGHTFVVVEHHPLFAEQSHHHIKLGPGSGTQGGQIIARYLQVASKRS